MRGKDLGETSPPAAFACFLVYVGIIIRGLLCFARRRAPNGKPAACRDLYGVYQPGPARRTARIRLACDVSSPECACILRRRTFHAHRGRHRRFQPAKRPAHAPVRHGRGDGRIGRDHGGGAVWLFHQPFLWHAVPAGHSLWAGRGQRGRIPEQLRSAALYQPPHELAALHVGRGRGGRPVHHGRGAHRRLRLAKRVPLGGADPGGAHGGSVPQPAHLEKAAGCR